MKKKPIGLSISPVRATLLPTPPDEAKQSVPELANLDQKYITLHRLSEESSFKDAFKVQHDGKNYVLFKFKDPSRGSKELETFKKIIRSNNCNTHAICPVEIGTYNGDIAIVTDFIEGITLETYIDLVENEEYNLLRTKLKSDEFAAELSFLNSINLMKKIIKSLLFIHNVWQFVHLDIKPDNIMISNDLRNVYIIDLGSGCFNDANVDCEDRNATEKYGAPENIKSELYVKPDYWSKGGDFNNWKLADIYSVGVVFGDLTRITSFCNETQINTVLELIKAMTNEDYSMRPTGEKVLETLNLIERIQCDKYIQNIGRAFMN
jgi:serine/threonine protein kinase